jgi:hypothetical protein
MKFAGTPIGEHRTTRKQSRPCSNIPRAIALLRTEKAVSLQMRYRARAPITALPIRLSCRLLPVVGKYREVPMVKSRRIFKSRRILGILVRRKAGGTRNALDPARQVMENYGQCL